MKLRSILTIAAFLFFTTTYSQNVGIGITNPVARLHVADSNVLFSSYQQWFLPSVINNPPISGNGTRMMWYAGKAAFRAGAVSSTAWDKDSIGKYSFAAGLDAKAKGDYSTALGVNNNSLDWYSFTAGHDNTAFAAGAVSIGANNESRNTGSITLGNFLISKSVYATALGTLNDTSDLQRPIGASDFTDRIFQIGNGVISRSNALTVLRNGNTGIGTVNPVARLHVADSNVLFTGPTPFVNYDPPQVPPIQGAGTRMMWYSQKGAFRAGWVEDNRWNKDSIGIFSTALGHSTLASYTGSTALGVRSSSRGTASTAFGWGSTANADYSTAGGFFSRADAANSIALGTENLASGIFSTSIGIHTVSSGNSSFAVGDSSIASGTQSIAIGSYVTAKARASFSAGWLNDNTDNPDPNFPSPADRVFQIGNGNPFLATRANAITILRNGNMGIGTINPVARLHVDSSVVFTGRANLPVTAANPPVSGAGTRMMWYVDKAAFRSGNVDGTQWDKDSIGSYSFATGVNNKAKGSGSFASGHQSSATGAYSTAIGEFNIASGFISTALGAQTIASSDISTAMGFATRATGFYSTAMGQSTTASGDVSTATGFITTASGINSFAMGESTTASGLNSIAFGQSTVASGVISLAGGVQSTAAANYSTSIGYVTKAKSPFSAVFGVYNDTTNTNRLFEIGNGTGDFARSNALTVLLNGKVGIGVSNPAKQTEIIGAASATPVTLVIGNRGGFGPAAMEFVSDYGFSNQWRPGYIKSNDAGTFTGALEFYTNGTGAGNLYGNVKGLEVRNGVTYTATGTVSSWSDARLKTNIQPFTDGLDVIKKINPVSFNYNNLSPFTTDKKQIGILAQELERIAPYMVDKTTTKDFEELRSVNNQAYTFLLINAIKELAAQNEKQQKEIDELKKLIKTK